LSLLREVDNAEIRSLKEEYYVRVHLKDNSLFRYAPRRMSFAEKAQLEDITNDLLTRGIIKPSISPYCARVVLVNKQNGQKRMCVDLRPLNQRISAQKYPFPIIEDQIARHIKGNMNLLNFLLAIQRLQQNFKREFYMRFAH